MRDGRLTLSLDKINNPDVYPILVTFGEKVNFRVPSCVDMVVDTREGYDRNISFRLILHSRTKIGDEVYSEVVRCD